MADALQLMLGSPIDPDTLSPNFANFALDGSTDAVEYLFQAPAAITITKLGFRYGARTGTPPTYRISLQSAVNGVPDGTILGATNNALKTFTPPADATWDGTWQWHTLDETATVARGAWLAVVIDYSSGTINGTNTSSFTSHMASFGGQRRGFPYAIQNNATVRTRQPDLPIFGYTSASVTYGRPLEAIAVGTAFSSGSSPNEYGMRFTIPSTWWSTYKVLGVRWFGTNANGSGDSCEVKLYDGDADPGTVLQQITYDWDNNQTTGNTRVQDIYFDEATLSTLNAGTAYTIGLTPNEASVAMTLYQISVDAVGDWAAWPGGQQFALATRAGSTWTVTTTTRPLMALILDDITAPSGGGVIGGPNKRAGLQ